MPGGTDGEGVWLSFVSIGVCRRGGAYAEEN